MARLIPTLITLTDPGPRTAPCNTTAVPRTSYQTHTAYLSIFETEKQGIAFGTCKLHTGHGHDIAKKREGGYQL